MFKIELNTIENGHAKRELVHSADSCQQLIDYILPIAWEDCGYFLRKTSWAIRHEKNNHLIALLYYYGEDDNEYPSLFVHYCHNHKVIEYRPVFHDDGSYSAIRVD